MKSTGKTILFAIVGGLLGGLVGAVVFVGAGYALAEIFGVENRETQAYFRAFIAMPLGAMIGVLTGATGMAAIPARSKTALVSVALTGTIVLSAVTALGVYWGTPKRPAQFRVRNETTAPLQRTYLGHDFRRATSLDSIAPGTVSDYHTVDLDQRGSFNAVRAVHRGHHIQLTLDLSRQTSLAPGRYTYVVREQASKVTLELQMD